MNKETTQLILEHLDKIAYKLGTTVEQVWPWFVKQQYVDAFYYLGISALIWAVFFVSLRFFIKHYKPNSGYSIHREGHEECWLIVLTIIFTIASFSLCLGIFEFPDVFNPELHALKAIIKLAR